MSRVLSTAGLAAACTFALGAMPAFAQGKGPGGYPLKPIRFLVPFAPGGTTDLVARLVSQRLSDELGQQLVVDNRGGAGGTIAAEIVARSAGDGYTLKMNHQGMTFNATLYPKLPFDTAKAFAAIGQIGITPNVLVVNTAVPAKTVNEFVALAKKGGNIPFGSGGMGSSAHLAVELFMLQTGVKMLHVPYKGAGPALADTIGGQVQQVQGTACRQPDGWWELRSAAVDGPTPRFVPAAPPVIVHAPPPVIYDYRPVYHGPVYRYPRPHPQASVHIRIGPHHRLHHHRHPHRHRRW